MDRSGTMSSLDVDEIVSSFDAKMMHPKDGPGFTHGVLGNPVANHAWHNSLELFEPMWVEITWIILWMVAKSTGRCFFPMITPSL